MNQSIMISVDLADVGCAMAPRWLPESLSRPELTGIVERIQTESFAFRLRWYIMLVSYIGGALEH